MTALLNVMTKVIVAGFYTANAALFLIVMAFCFGFMRGQEHMALAGYFIGSPGLTLVPVVVWVLYALHVVTFNNAEIAKDTSNVLYSLPLAPARVKWLVLATTAFNQLLPAIAYGLFLIAVAAKNSMFVSIAMIGSCLIVLTAFVTWRMHGRLVFPQKEIVTSGLFRKLDRNFAKPLPWISVEGITRMQPGTVYGTKLFSCLIVYGALQLYQYDTYDARLYSMAACAAFAANLNIVFLYQRFEAESFNMTRSLPIALSRRMITFSISMLLFCIPEILMLTINIPDQIAAWNSLYAILFGMSLSLLGYGALYVRDTDFDSFTKWIFFVAMGWVMLILFHTPLLIGSAIQAAIGVYLFKTNFYRFQLAS